MNIPFNLRGAENVFNNFPFTIPIPSALLSIAFQFVPILVISFAFWDQKTDHLKSQWLTARNGEPIEEYDFIIVGAGSAGSVLANRLTENGTFRVLLLEAGGKINPLQYIPMLCPVLLRKPELDYSFFTVPQENSCLALKEQKSFWSRGKGFGGSSNLNGMLYQRGNRYDYDRWAELSGSDEWKFDNVLRNFKNVEDYHGAFYNATWHSRNGNGVYVSVSNEKRLLPEFLEAGREMGYPTADGNGNQEASFSPLDVSIKHGHRHSAFSAFLEPVLNRNNLIIYRYARVLRIKLDKRRRAHGLIYERHGIQWYVKARKKIILSAGAIDSPKILMLSGIGPKSHLQRLGIRNIVDLPVGQNLQDHLMTTLPFTIETTGATFKMDRDFTLNTIKNYFATGTGILSAPLLSSATAYVHSSNNKTANLISSPDIQLLMLVFAPNAYELFENFGNYKSGFLDSYFRNPQGKDGFLLDVMLAKCKSRGEIRLASSNPSDMPLINPKYFSHPDDIKNLVAGIDFAVKMLENSKAFKKHGTRLLHNPPPGCEKFPFKSNQYFECVARHVTLTVFHPCGTCSMGKGENDPNAVVDHKLRVLKTKGLRVVDASVMPEIPNSNLNAAVYMLADKASEMILDYWS